MKSQKGITLTSLSIYILVLIIVLGILGIITSSFQKSIKDINSEGTKNAEIDKFNVYFLQEVKKVGNGISSINTLGTEIIFTTNNKYTFKENGIYLNDNIKIAQDITKCKFFQSLVNGKTIITVNIQAKSSEEKTIEYVLSNESYDISYEDEEKYISIKEEQETVILPEQYQQVGYVTFQNDATNGYNNCINTLVTFNEADEIEFTYKSVDTTNKLMFIAGYTTTPNGMPYLANESGYYYKNFTSINMVPSSLTRAQASDGTKRTINLTYTSSSTNYISFGSWIDSAWSRTIDWYSFKIWKEDTQLRDFIPCYRKSDNVAGMYDIVNEIFYTNSGTGAFVAGSEK